MCICNLMIFLFGNGNIGSADLSVREFFLCRVFRCFFSSFFFPLLNAQSKHIFDRTICGNQHLLHTLHDVANSSKNIIRIVIRINSEIIISCDLYFALTLHCHCCFCYCMLLFVSSFCYIVN